MVVNISLNFLVILAPIIITKVYIIIIKELLLFSVLFQLYILRSWI